MSGHSRLPLPSNQLSAQALGEKWVAGLQQRRALSWEAVSGEDAELSCRVAALKEVETAQMALDALTPAALQAGEAAYAAASRARVAAAHPG